MTERSKCKAPLARRALLAVLGAAMLSWAGPGRALTLDDVARRAQALAAAPFEERGGSLPEEVRRLSYDQYRDIRFRPEKALWRGRGSRFEVMFFHQGWFFDRPVRINEITAAGVREVAFDPADFDYGKNEIDARRLGRLGFAGFRVHFPINTPTYKDETLVFLGASYFRALGRGQRYGVSARGLAIDTALSVGEEFPRFVEFWIERPAPAASELTIFALLDSPRAAGAYRFVLRPGVTTILDVDARLFLRDRVGKLGVAPLTSMFFFGANQHAAKDDYRPEVHDSDGLLVQTSAGEWIWRPLASPRRLLVTSFALTDPLGFGLMQRERRFARYEDLEARYEMRPSAWIEPKDAWGAGRVELVEIPLPDETNDNVVAYWVPERAPGPGEPADYRYRVLWQKDREAHGPLAWVRQTLRGRGYTRTPDDTVEFHVDFVGPALERLPADARVEGVVSAGAGGRIVEQNTVQDGPAGGWRVVLRVSREDRAEPLELRASLRVGSQIVSETWSYVLPPE